MKLLQLVPLAFIFCLSAALAQTTPNDIEAIRKQTSSEANKEAQARLKYKAHELLEQSEVALQSGDKAKVINLLLQRLPILEEFYGAESERIVYPKNIS